MIDPGLFTSLRDVATRVASLRSGVRWYLFGSAARDAPFSADVDVLALCPDDAAANTVRKELCAPANEYPLHLMIITQREEDELRFISGQNCKELFAA